MPPQNLQLTDRRINVDVILSNLSLGIAADQEFIGDLILKRLPQPLASALLAKFGSEGFFLVDDALGDWAEPKRLDIALGQFRVDVEGHALAGVVSARHQHESQQGPVKYDLYQGVVTTVKQNMLLRREYLQATLLQNSAVYTAAGSVVSVTGTNRFDDAASDPLTFLAPYIEETIPDLIGKRPNTVWIGQQVWTKLITNAKVQSRIFGPQAPQSLPTAAQIASLLGVERILVGRAVTKTAAGASTRVWGKNLGIAWVPPAAGQQIPAFGYTVEQTIFNGASEAVSRVFDEKIGPAGGWWTKRAAFYTSAITFPEAGMLFTTVVS